MNSGIVANLHWTFGWNFEMHLNGTFSFTSECIVTRPCPTVKCFGDSSRITNTSVGPPPTTFQHGNSSIVTVLFVIVLVTFQPKQPPTKKVTCAFCRCTVWDTEKPTIALVSLPLKFLSSCFDINWEGCFLYYQLNFLWVVTRVCILLMLCCVPCVEIPNKLRTSYTSLKKTKTAELLSTVALSEFWVNFGWILGKPPLPPFEMKCCSPPQWGTVPAIHFVSKQQWDTQCTRSLRDPELITGLKPIIHVAHYVNGWCDWI